MDEQELALVGINAVAVIGRVNEAAVRSGRKPGEVRLIGISKKKPSEAIQKAFDAGIREFGENYVQEAEAKAPFMPEGSVLHMVGGLQRNKARKAARIFSIVQSVDSTNLADALDNACLELDRRMEVLIEVNMAGEQVKSGVGPEGLFGLLAHFEVLKKLTCTGIMVIPPVEDASSYFPEARELLERARAANFANTDMRELSMGMSSDFEEAIREGATMVRIGRAIFGQR